MSRCSEEIIICLLLVFLALRSNITRVHNLDHPEASVNYAWKLKETNDLWPNLYDSVPFISEITDDALIFELGKESMPSILIKSNPINITVGDIQKLEIFEVGLKHSSFAWDNDISLCYLDITTNKWKHILTPKKYITDFGYTHGYDIKKYGVYVLC